MLKMKNVILVIVFLMMISGCSTIPKVKLFEPDSQLQKEELQSYKVGETMRAYVGEAIIVKSSMHYMLISEGKFRALTSLSAGAFKILEEGIYRAVYVDLEDGGVYVKGEPDSGMLSAAKIDKSGRLIHKKMFYHNIGGWQDHSLVTIGQVGKRLFEPIPTTKRYLPESFKVEIIYLGTARNDIRASYREYKNDIARPAFYQDLSYNIESSDVIRYRNFRIKVLRATNEEIEYIVIED